MGKYDKMTPDQLTDEQLKIDEEIAALRAKKREIANARDAALGKEEADRLLANLSDDTKRALHQSISAMGIESGEDVGTPA